jgi:K+-transporting ATPase ATPase C chain
MWKELKRGVLFTVVSMALVFAYHLVMWGVAEVAFPSQAAGSLIRRGDGTVVGSSLIAQRFTRPEYFHPRPSAVGYDAAAAGGSNYGPSNPEQLAAVRRRLDALTGLDSAPPGAVPSEMVTASGSGLDPDIPPAAAELQAPRVARARGVPLERVRELVQAHTEPPTFGFLGRARVNVLELNLALDASLSPAPPVRR